MVARQLVPSEVATDTPSDMVASGDTLVSEISTGPPAATANTCESVPDWATLPVKVSVVVAAAVGVVGAVLDEPQVAAAANAAASKRRCHPNRMIRTPL